MDARSEYLLKKTKFILETFRSGRNPTFVELDALEAAIAGCEQTMVCEHRWDEGCTCFTTGPRE